MRSFLLAGVLLSSAAVAQAQVWPIEIGQASAPLTSAFGSRWLSATYIYDWHYGVDIRNQNDTTVVAAHDGIVDWRGINGGYGMMIFVGEAYYTYATGYAHLTAYNAEVGDPVLAGLQIAECSYPIQDHLHFNYYTRNIWDLYYGSHPHDADTDNPMGFLPYTNDSPSIGDPFISSDGHGTYIGFVSCIGDTELDFMEATLYVTGQDGGGGFHYQEEILGGDFPNNYVDFNQRMNVSTLKQQTSYPIVNEVKTIPSEFNPGSDQELTFKFYVDSDVWNTLSLVSFYAAVTDLLYNSAISTHVDVILGICPPNCPPPGAPDPPTNLEATANYDSVTIDLTWDGTYGGYGFFVIYRRPYDSDPFALQAIGITCVNDYQDEYFTEGAQYYYAVAAVNEIGESLNSNEVLVTAPVDPPPAAPQDLTVSSVSGHPYLEWDANTEPDLDHYNIWVNYTTFGEPSFWHKRTETTYTYWTDYNVNSGGSKPPDICNYKITAEDVAENVSGFSNTVRIRGDVIYWPIPKRIPEYVQVPDHYDLHASYPNPFNPATTIRYDLPEASNVTLVIYDLMGRGVMRWDQQEDAGYKQVIWDGKDQSGRLAPASIYIYRFIAASVESDKRFSATRKMVLMK